MRQHTLHSSLPLARVNWIIHLGDLTQGRAKSAVHPWPFHYPRLNLSPFFFCSLIPSSFCFFFYPTTFALSPRYIYCCAARRRRRQWNAARKILPLFYSLPLSLNARVINPLAGGGRGRGRIFSFFFTEPLSQAQLLLQCVCRLSCKFHEYRAFFIIYNQCVWNFNSQVHLRIIYILFIRLKKKMRNNFTFKKI